MISRRNFAISCFGLVAAGDLGAASQSESIGSAVRNHKIDQNPIRRRGTGLRGLDLARVSPGYTLFSPMDDDGTVYVIDLCGEVVHTWKMPYPPGLYGYLTNNGTIFYNGKIPNDSFLGQSPWKGGVVLEADWNGRVLWEVRHPDHHHDGCLLRNGNVLLVCATELPDEIARKVQGGRPGTEDQGRMWADYLVEMTKDGRKVWEWRTWEHLDPTKDRISEIQADRSEWTHANGVAELPDANLLVSFRDISTIIKIERRTGEIVWKLGAPILCGQHAPTPLPNGNILIFDNGCHRPDDIFPFSRVLEVNPSTNEIVWKYQEAIPSNFFSPLISNAVRLPNGNTLINEEWFGRFFEVTQNGETVWEYVNPYFVPPNEGAGAQDNSVFRVYRYTEKEIAKARKRT